MLNESQSVGQQLEAMRQAQAEPLSKSTWAQQVGISNTELSFYLNQRRLPSAEKLSALLSVIDISESERKQIELQWEFESAIDLTSKANALRKQLPKRVPENLRDFKNLADFLGDWVVPVVQAFLGQVGRRVDSARLARLLLKPTRVERVGQAVTKLRKLGLLQTDGVQVTQTRADLKTPDHFPNAIIGAYHEQHIKIALELLAELGAENRSLATVIAAIPPERFPEFLRLVQSARSMMATQLREWTAELRPEQDPLVVQFSMQGLPLSANFAEDGWKQTGTNTSEEEQ